MTYAHAAELALEDHRQKMNATAIIHALNNALTAIWQEAHHRDHSDSVGWINQHPILRLYLHKLMLLNGLDTPGMADLYAQAERDVEAIVAKAHLSEPEALHHGR